MLKGSVNVMAALILVLSAAFLAAALGSGMPIATAVVGTALGVYLSAAPRVIQEWERGGLLRLGKFRRILQPGS